MTSESSFRSLWSEAEKALGDNVTLLVNNAGVAPGKSGWLRTVEVCGTGTAIGTFVALDNMDRGKGGRGGRIVNVASLAGLTTAVSDVKLSAYNMAKWGSVGLTRCFGSAGTATEERHGVKAYALCPWFAATAIWREDMDLGARRKPKQT